MNDDAGGDALSLLTPQQLEGLIRFLRVDGKAALGATVSALRGVYSRALDRDPAVNALRSGYNELANALPTYGRLLRADPVGTLAGTGVEMGRAALGFPGRDASADQDRQDRADFRYGAENFGAGALAEGVKGGGKLPRPPSSDFKILAPEEYLRAAKEYFGEDRGWRPVTVKLDEVVGGHNFPPFNDPGRTAAHQQAYRAGQPQPIVVNRVGNGWNVLDGNRRLAAAAAEGLSEVPAVEVTGPVNAPTAQPRAVSTIPWARMTPDEALAAAVRGEHLQQKKGGQFIGAPPGVTTMEQVEANRALADQYVDKGIEGGPWYLQDRDTLSELAPGDPQQQRQLARLLAVYSNQAGPRANLERALTQYNAHQMRGAEAGERSRPYMRHEAELGRAAIEGDFSANLGPKIDPFFKTLDPTRDYGSISQIVNDRHRARANGFPANTEFLSDTAHSFLQGEGQLQTQRLIERLRNGPALAQRLNAEYAGQVPVTVSTTQAAEWRGKRLADAQARAAAEGRTLTPDEVAEAGTNYTRELPNVTAYGLEERVAGANTGHMTGEVGLPYGAKEQITARRSPATKGGKHVVYDALGAVQPDMLPDRGDYAGPAGAETNPLDVARVLIGRTKGAISPDSRAMLDLGTLFDATMQGQNAQGWFALKPSSARAATGYRASFGQPLPAAQIDALRAQLGSQGYVIHGLSGGDYLVTTDQYAGTRPGLPAPVVPGARLQPGVVESGFFDLTKGWQAPQGSGTQTEALVKALRKRPLAADALSSRQVRDWIRKLNDVDPQIAAELGVGGPRPDLVKLRRIWEREGAEGLLKRIKKNGGKAAGLGLPSVLLAPQFSGQQQEPAQE